MAIESILDSIAWADDEFSTSVIEGIVLLARDDRERERRGIDRLDYATTSSAGETFVYDHARDRSIISGTSDDGTFH